jgi:hypothetical protein
VLRTDDLNSINMVFRHKERELARYEKHYDSRPPKDPIHKARPRR